MAATCSQHATTILGGHSLAETVLVHAAAVVGLKCSFHLVYIIIVLCWDERLRRNAPNKLQNYR